MRVNTHAHTLLPPLFILWAQAVGPEGVADCAVPQSAPLLETGATGDRNTTGTDASLNFLPKF